MKRYGLFLVDESCILTVIHAKYVLSLCLGVLLEGRALVNGYIRCHKTAKLQVIYVTYPDQAPQV